MADELKTDPRITGAAEAAEAQPTPLNAHSALGLGEEEAESTDPQFITITVDGTTQEMPIEKAKELLQKGVAAEKRFAEASETRKLAEGAISSMADLRKVVFDKDKDAYKRLADDLGIAPEQQKAVLAGWGAPEEVSDDGTPVKGATKAPPARQSIRYEDLPADVQRSVAFAESQRIEGLVKKAVDTDEFLAYNIGRLDDRGRATIGEYIEQQIRGRLDASDGDFGDGTQVLPSVIATTRKHMESLGILERPTPRIGLGPSPGGGGPDHPSTKPPKHVSSNHPDFEDSVMETLEWAMQEGNLPSR